MRLIKEAPPRRGFVLAGLKTGAAGLTHVNAVRHAGPHTGRMTPTLHVPEFDAELIARYDVAAPRYTSYPTAPQFHPGFGEAQLREAIRASNQADAPRPLSLYVHVPFCWSPCFYCGCTRIITHDKAKADRYLERLYREVELTAPLFDAKRPVRQLHFGGGTPNFLDIERMRELLRVLARH